MDISHSINSARREVMAIIREGRSLAVLLTFAVVASSIIGTFLVAIGLSEQFSTIAAFFILMLILVSVRRYDSIYLRRFRRNTELAVMTGANQLLNKEEYIHTLEDIRAEEYIDTVAGMSR